MKSIWENKGEEEPKNITNQIKTLVEDNVENGRFRASRPPQDIQLSRIFNFLGGKRNLIEKRAAAADVLLGKHGLKNRIHAKLLLGPKEFQEVIQDPRDIVPELIELLGEKNVDIRINAARVLGERGDERALVQMCGGLGEPEYWARYEFGQALGEMCRNIKDTEVLEMLRDVIKQHVEEKGEFSGTLRKVSRRLWELAKLSGNERKTPFANVPKINVGPSAGARPDTTVKLFRKQH